MLDPEKVKERIAAALPGSEVEVKDLTGTGDHFEAKVVSAEFDGSAQAPGDQALVLVATG